MPNCHGAGGLAGQYYFGARTGGTNIIEGLIEVSLGLWSAKSIANFFVAFPSAIIGAMMFLAGIELAKFAKDLRGTQFLTMGVTTAVSLTTNMVIGFAAGALAYYLCTRFWGYSVNSASLCFLLPRVQPQINYGPNPENDGAIGNPATMGIVSQGRDLASPPGSRKRRRIHLLLVAFDGTPEV